MVVVSHQVTTPGSEWGLNEQGADEGAAQTAYCNDRVVGGFSVICCLESYC